MMRITIRYAALIGLLAWPSIGRSSEPVELDQAPRPASGSGVAVEKQAKYERLIRKAVGKYGAGNYEDALALYEKASRLAPDEPIAQDGIMKCRGILLRTMAQGLVKERRFDEAIAIYEESKRVDPSGAEYAQRAIDAAKRDREKTAVAGKRNAAAGASVRANELLLAGRHAEAEAAYREALALEPEEAVLHRGLGSALLGQSRFPEAELALREGIRRAPSDAALYQALGLAAAQQGRADEAEQAYRRAIELDPAAVHAMSNLATLLRARKSIDEAEALYRRAIELDPTQTYIAQNLELLLQEKALEEPADAVVTP